MSDPNTPQIRLAIVGGGLAGASIMLAVKGPVGLAANSQAALYQVVSSSDPDSCVTATEMLTRNAQAVSMDSTRILLVRSPLSSVTGFSYCFFLLKAAMATI